MPNTQECPLKGGHPPAVKAGGMRISQHKPEKEMAGTPPQTDPDDVELAVTPPKTQIKQMINGVLAKGDADFPADAVKAFHENKPVPTHEYRSAGNHTKPMMIHQPGKK